MDAITDLCVAAGVSDSMLAAINERLSAVGLSISEEDASMLAVQRSKLLADAERVEFGTPALLAIAEAVASSPCLTPRNAADTLARLQGTFYELRDELPVDVPDSEIVDALRCCLDELDARTDAALDVRREIIALMPSIRNVALRDTLASLGELKKRYDTRFLVHEVPCDIDYQLSNPVDPALMGIDYIEAYLAQLLKETRWIAQFDVKSCVAVLERVCPDHRGLHVNLYDLLAPHEDELQDRTK